MEFDSLLEFIGKQMSMSHIYQPLLIKSLVEAGGSATLRQLAQAFLLQDESQLIYYENKIKQMPLRVLLKHNVIKRDGEFISLNTKNLTYQQKAQIKMICGKRLQEYIQKKGLGIWDYRILDTEPVSGSLRSIVFNESGGRCAKCGITKRDRPLDVDHIKPRSKKGKTVYENLQILCSKCNREKGNKEEIDYRKDLPSDSDPSCLFCSADIRDRKIEEYESVFAVKDNFPVSQGHLLVIPFRHSPDFFSMTSREKMEAADLIRILQKKISQDDPSVTGFNLGVNCGISAGQTIMHAHIHLIPRRDGDTPDPRGGVRGVIPEKMAY